MYFWNTNLLVDNLKKGLIESKDIKNYYVAGALLYYASYYIALLSPPKEFSYLALEASSMSIITIFGINAVFNANGGSSGKNFLDKVVSISCPLLVKILVFSMVLGSTIGILRFYGICCFETKWFSSVLGVFIQAAFFWRLVVHVKNTNT